MNIPDRTPFRSPRIFVSFWDKDGLWHVAKPCPDPDPETGLKTGGMRWTDEAHISKIDALRAHGLIITLSAQPGRNLRGNSAPAQNKTNK